MKCYDCPFFDYGIHTKGICKKHDEIVRVNQLCVETEDMVMEYLDKEGIEYEGYFDTPKGKIIVDDYKIIVEKGDMKYEMDDFYLDVFFLDRYVDKYNEYVDFLSREEVMELLTLCIVRRSYVCPVNYYERCPDFKGWGPSVCTNCSNYVPNAKDGFCVIYEHTVNLRETKKIVVELIERMDERVRSTLETV